MRLYSPLALLRGNYRSLQETAPWKMSEEMLAVMGGKLSPLTAQYLQLCTAALSAARKHSDMLLGLMEIISYKSNFPSLKYNRCAIRDFRNRLLLDVSDVKLEAEVEKLFGKSSSNSGTNLYDQFQLVTNGIAV
jgi:phosphatidylinositol kinase/protein kinase (PI-3  family)